MEEGAGGVGLRSYSIDLNRDSVGVKFVKLFALDPYFLGRTLDTDLAGVALSLAFIYVYIKYWQNIGIPV
jgi:hypothetical protein